MGYGSRAIIVDKSSLFVTTDNGQKMFFAQVIANFDLCKAGDFSSIFKKKTDCFFYADDGDTQILDDFYYEPLGEATVQEVIAWLEQELSIHSYWRFNVLLATLKEIENQAANWPSRQIVVLHYGY